METLEKLAEQMLTPGGSVYRRAVDLFEFQTAIFLDKRKWRRRARKFAAIKLMENLERANDIKSGDISSALKLPDYPQLLCEVLGQGWLPVRRLPSDKVFDSKLKAKIEDARIASNVVEFLCSCNAERSIKRPSVNKAIYVLNRQKKLNNYAATVAKAKWRDHAKWSIFVHLLLEKEHKFIPPRLGTKSFAVKLLQQAENVTGLTSFFGAYNQVERALPKPQKVYPSFAPTNLEPLLEPISYGPVSDDVKSKLEDYNSIEGG